MAQNVSVSSHNTSEWHGEKLDPETARVLVADRKIIGFDIDTTNQIVFLRLQNEAYGKLKPSGTLVAFDLFSEELIWEKEMNYSKELFFFT